MKPLRCVLGVLAFTTCHAGAATVSLTPIEDTTLSEDNLARTAFNSDTLIVGRLGPNGGESKSRALLRFDLSSVPTNATVTSVTLTVNITRNHLGGSDVHVLNRLNSPWTEEDAAWTTSGLVPWLGGNFEEESDSTVGLGFGLATFPSTPAMIATVRLWLDDPTMNNGWVLRNGDESTSGNARRILSREAFSNQPLLTIEYSTPPPPPPPGVMARVRVEDGKFQFEFTATPGTNYAVQYKEVVHATNWVDLVNYPNPATETVFTVEDWLTSTNRFYRIVTPPTP